MWWLYVRRQIKQRPKNFLSTFLGGPTRATLIRIPCAPVTSTFCSSARSRWRWLSLLAPVASTDRRPWFKERDETVSPITKPKKILRRTRARHQPIFGSWSKTERRRAVLRRWCATLSSVSHRRRVVVVGLARRFRRRRRRFATDPRSTTQPRARSRTNSRRSSAPAPARWTRRPASTNTCRRGLDARFGPTFFFFFETFAANRHAPSTHPKRSFARAPQDVHNKKFQNVSFALKINTYYTHHVQTKGLIAD